MRLEHIAITITNSKELNDFYHNVLGFEIDKGFELNKTLSEKIFNIASSAQVCVMKKDNLALEIFVYPGINNQKYNHICLLLKNREDIYNKAINKGYHCIRIERDPCDMIFLKDRNGNVFEMKEDSNV